MEEQDLIGLFIIIIILASLSSFILGYHTEYVALTKEAAIGGKK